MKLTNLITNAKENQTIGQFFSIISMQTNARTCQRNAENQHQERPQPALAKSLDATKPPRDGSAYFGSRLMVSSLPEVITND